MQSSDYFGRGPQRELAEAAGRGEVKTVAHLLSAGADIDYQGKEGMTALVWAFLQGNRAGYQFLLEHGANPNIRMQRSQLTSDGLTDGNCATSLAAMHEDPWFLEITLKHHGDPNIRNPIKGVTPIFQCTQFFDKEHPRIEQIKMLIAAGANLDALDKYGSSPCRYAAILNRYDLVYIMLEAGADPTVEGGPRKALADTIKRIRTSPRSDEYRWREKVIQLLKSKGISVGASE